jgi:hypothetical protein
MTTVPDIPGDRSALLALAHIGACSMMRRTELGKHRHQDQPG